MRILLFYNAPFLVEAVCYGGFLYELFLEAEIFALDVDFFNLLYFDFDFGVFVSFETLKNDDWFYSQISPFESSTIAIKFERFS